MNVSHIVRYIVYSSYQYPQRVLVSMVGINMLGLVIGLPMYLSGLPG